MSETILEADIRDTNAETASNDSGAIADTQLFHVVNGLDAEVTVTFYGTRQEDAGSFSESVQLGSVTVSADSNDYETLSDPWEEVQIEVVASTSPSSGTVAVHEMN